MEDLKIFSKQEYLKANKKPDQEKAWNQIGKRVKIKEPPICPIINNFQKNKKGLVIDLGCGAGWNMISNPNLSYYGIDFSEKGIELTKKHIKKHKINAKIYKSKVSSLNKKIFKNNMFDLGLFIATLHCIETPKQRQKSLKELYRVLKPNSQALITIWNSNDQRFNKINNTGDIYMQWDPKTNIMRYYYLYKKQELLNLIKQTGFKIMQVYKPQKDRFSKKNLIIRIKKSK
jgi:ubiquinone/menaquinone biosynthesis C-methylase UbiE